MGGTERPEQIPDLLCGILGQDADCVDSRMAVDSEDHVHTDNTDAADNAPAHVEHADHNVGACLPLR